MKCSLLISTVLMSASLLSACSHHEEEPASSNTKKTDEHITPARKPEKTSIDWTKPSGGEFPNIKQKKVWIDVNVKEQKAYIKEGSNTIYTMIVSSGLDQTKDDATPKGTFYVEPERGEWFFSEGYQEGAEYWVSWKNHGEFLFHSVPMTKDKKVIEKEAEKLGMQASHGCIRLTIPDAKWIYENIPEHTKVVIS
ncbi:MULTISPECIES: L,D-transpeptidase [unclassified Bacillus (in: firmicutes)]|uniref:L,D-transpeptidase n=1 Tax=unclassified Bacillus (in: firmicutes) TaxID=185979 RepID=UPI00227F8B32|nr:L,D-transpeptidase [Bacillus sp. S20C3]MCY8203130.1 L,D-transpeptidase [Bacillus sp. N12A5]MCY8287582.1 L,D-transpeptidase [Bacillus sp. N13C7]MCY8638587.1 L,D-transpeptidase [Bacillus sp. S17B2]MCY9144699.1 L,D-transpeptidase [Bacillus sp. T9C1]